jgi:hypothetical protein
MSEFKATRICPFNPKAMDYKTRSSDAYLIQPINILDHVVLMEWLMKVNNGGRWNYHTTSEHNIYSR